MAILKDAEKHCAAHGHRFTDPRRQVLKIVAQAHKPLGAYDIIAAMPEGAKPPTVYRALEFWQQEGFIHRIDSLNVYTTCHAGHRHDGSQFMVCDTCGEAREIHLCALPRPLQEGLEKAGFLLSRWSAELHGTCRSCRKAP